MATVTYALEREPTPSGPQHIVLSTDEGLTWSDSPYVISGAPYWKDICAFPVFSTRAIGANGTNVYYTIDGGLSWTASAGTYAGGDTAPVLFAVSALVSYLAGENIAKSIDSGVTFDQLITVATITGNPGDVATSLFFQNDTYGFIGVGNKVYATSDGGVSWAPLVGGSDIVTGEPVKSIASDGLDIIVSTNWRILKSVDGGSTFTQTQVLPTLNPAATNYIKKVTPQVYYITLDGSTPANPNVFKTINGGDTWVGQGNSSVQAGSVDLVFYNTTTGLKLGKENTIIRSNNSFIVPVVSVYTARQIIKISADTYKCGVCPDGYTYDEGIDACEGVLTTIACPTGYEYDITTGKCRTIIAPFSSIDTNCGACPVEIVQDIAYCVCIEEIDIFPCCYLLTNCADPLIQISTQTDLSEYNGRILQLAEYPNECWSFEKVDGLCEGQEIVTVTSSFLNCIECKPSYRLINCKDSDVIIYTGTDLSVYTNPSKTIKIEEYPNDCWQVGTNTEIVPVVETVTVDGDPFATCLECDPTIYQLNSCFNPALVLFTYNDVSAYIGKTVTVEGYPGLCFTVSALQCNCLYADISDGSSTITLSFYANGTFNDRPIFSSGTGFSIYWDGTSWIFSDVALKYGFTSSMNIECPFTGYWTPGETFIAATLQTRPCADNFYNIVITKIYPDCECCLKKCN